MVGSVSSRANCGIIDIREVHGCRGCPYIVGSSICKELRGASLTDGSVRADVRSRLVQYGQRDVETCSAATRGTWIDQVGDGLTNTTRVGECLSEVGLITAHAHSNEIAGGW